MNFQLKVHGAFKEAPVDAKKKKNNPDFELRVL